MRCAPLPVSAGCLSRLLQLFRDLSLQLARVLLLYDSILNCNERPSTYAPHATYLGDRHMTALRRFGLLAPLAALSLSGCGLNSVPTAEEKVNAKWGNLQSRLSAPRRPHSEPGCNGEGLCPAGKDGAHRGDPGASRRQQRAAQRRRPQRSRQGAGVRECAGAAVQRDHSAAAAAGSLSGPQVQPELPGASGPAGRHGEPHQRFAPRLQFEAVQDYNTTIRTFPDAIGAKIFYGAKPKVPFEASTAAQTAPKVTSATRS